MAEEKKGSLSRSSGNKGKGRVWVPLVILFIFSLSYLGIEAWKIWNFPKEISVIPDSEYAIVLGAHSDGKTPSPVFEVRILEGIRLYKEGKVKKIIFTGKLGKPPQAVVAQNYSRDLGVPLGDILIETQSCNTQENLLFAQQLLPNPHQSSVLLVSDPLHLKRASLIAEDLKMNFFPAPVRQSLIQSFPQKVKFLLRETLALASYRLSRILGLSLKGRNSAPKGN